MDSDFLRITQEKLDQDQERYDQIQRVRQQVGEVGSALNANIEAYKIILKTHEKFGTVFNHFPDFLSDAIKGQVPDNGMVISGEDNKLSEFIGDPSIGGGGTGGGLPEPERPFQLEQPQDDTVSSNGAKPKARGDNVRAILDVVRKAGDGGLTSSEIWQRIQAMDVDMNQNTMYSAIHKLKKSDRLRYEGDRYYIGTKENQLVNA